MEDTTGKVIKLSFDIKDREKEVEELCRTYEEVNVFFDHLGKPIAVVRDIKNPLEGVQKVTQTILLD